MTPFLKGEIQIKKLVDGERYYFLDVPYLSSNLSRVYNKNVVIFEGEYNSLKRSIPSRKKHFLNNGVWNESEASMALKHQLDYLDDDQFSKLFDGSIGSRNGRKGSNVLVFSTLEMAKIAKIMLLKQVKDNFDKKIELLKEGMDKKMTKTDEALEYIKEQHPELFI